MYHVHSGHRRSWISKFCYPACGPQQFPSTLLRKSFIFLPSIYTISLPSPSLLPWTCRPEHLKFSFLIICSKNCNYLFLILSISLVLLSFSWTSSLLTRYVDGILISFCRTTSPLLFTSTLGRLTNLHYHIKAQILINSFHCF